MHPAEESPSHQDGLNEKAGVTKQAVARLPINRTERVRVDCHWAVSKHSRNRLIFHNMKVAKHQLTARQQQFCQLYAGPARHNAALAARMAGYAAASSHVTGCQLLKMFKIAATVRGLEEAVAREIGLSRQAVIAQLVGAFELAKMMENPASMVSAMRQVALMGGYFRQEPVKAKIGGEGQDVLDRMSGLTDAELLTLIAAA